MCSDLCKFSGSYWYEKTYLLLEGQRSWILWLIQKRIIWLIEPFSNSKPFVTILMSQWTGLIGRCPVKWRSSRRLKKSFRHLSLPTCIIDIHHDFSDFRGMIFWYGTSCRDSCSKLLDLQAQATAAASKHTLDKSRRHDIHLSLLL